MHSTSQKTALVTAASSGIGYASAEALARAGFTVFGTSRKPSGNSPGPVTMLACDVTDGGSVAALVSEVLARAGRIDVLVNTAPRHTLRYPVGKVAKQVSLLRRLMPARMFDKILRHQFGLPS